MLASANTITTQGKGMAFLVGSRHADQQVVTTEIRPPEPHHRQAGATGLVRGINSRAVEVIIPHPFQGMQQAAAMPQSRDPVSR